MKPVDPQVLDLLNSIGARMKELEHPSLDRLSPGESREYYQVAREFLPHFRWSVHRWKKRRL